ncbi:unnamed protein product [Amoebophrya sp. A25]|nr:unnamed protein product [Amoebophrya sp. A25]|eukprot:GSA25T00003200001.1
MKKEQENIRVYSLGGIVEPAQIVSELRDAYCQLQNQDEHIRDQDKHILQQDRHMLDQDKHIEQQDHHIRQLEKNFATLSSKVAQLEKRTEQGARGAALGSSPSAPEGSREGSTSAWRSMWTSLRKDAVLAEPPERDSMQHAVSTTATGPLGNKNSNPKVMASVSSQHDPPAVLACEQSAVPMSADSLLRSLSQDHNQLNAKELVAGGTCLVRATMQQLDDDVSTVAARSPVESSGSSCLSSPLDHEVSSARSSSLLLPPLGKLGACGDEKLHPPSEKNYQNNMLNMVSPVGGGSPANAMQIATSPMQQRVNLIRAALDCSSGTLAEGPPIMGRASAGCEEHGTCNSDNVEEVEPNNNMALSTSPDFTLTARDTSSTSPSSSSVLPNNANQIHVIGGAVPRVHVIGPGSLETNPSVVNALSVSSAIVDKLAPGRIVMSPRLAAAMAERKEAEGAKGSPQLATSSTMDSCTSKVVSSSTNPLANQNNSNPSNVTGNPLQLPSSKRGFLESVSGGLFKREGPGIAQRYWNYVSTMDVDPRFL